MLILQILLAVSHLDKSNEMANVLFILLQKLFCKKGIIEWIMKGNGWNELW